MWRMWLFSLLGTCQLPDPTRLTSALDGSLETGCERRGVIGQHIATTVLPAVLRDHLAIANPHKPLVVALCGHTCLQKTFTETLLRRHVFPTSHVVECSHYQVGVTDLAVAQEQLRRELLQQIRRCPQTLFVFDEIQFMPEALLEVLVPFIGTRQPVHIGGQTYDFRKSIFLLTTMDGGTRIAEYMLATRVPREQLTYSDFVDVLRNQTSVRSAWLSAKSLVDYFIPYLPIEREQALLGVERELQRLSCQYGITWNPSLPAMLTDRAMGGRRFLDGGLCIVERLIIVEVLATATTPLPAVQPLHR